MNSRSSKTALNILVLLLVLIFMIAVNNTAQTRKILPEAKNAPFLQYARTQQEIYNILKSCGVHGAHLVHINMYFNMVDYFPVKETVSMQFPIRTYDTRPTYEHGLDSHNWLFIATRTGIVRRVTTVLPVEVMEALRPEFLKDFSFSPHQGGFSGYSYEIPRLVTTLEHLSCGKEPVIVTVDAGYFSGKTSPEQVDSILRKQCPDIRLLVAVESTDEQEVTDEMRGRLDRFAGVWRGTGD